MSAGGDRAEHTVPGEPQGGLGLLPPLRWEPWWIFSFFLLAALGLRCCTRAFSSCGERGLLFVAVRGLLIAVASLVAEHRL